MRAVALTEWGGPEVLRPMDLPPEPLGPGQVRIRVTAATVNPTDTLTRSGALAAYGRGLAEPVVPGMDAAGVVTELGPDVDTGLVPGDRVFTLVRPDGSHGAYREDLVVDAAALGRTPAGCTDVAASTLALNGCTARHALDLLALRPGQVVAVSGAAGAVGGFAVQLAKADGLTVVADAAAADEDLVRELGADVVVRRGDDVAARIREAFPDGVDGVVDAALLHELLTPAVRDGGGFATVRGWPGDGTRGITFPFAIAPEYGSDPAVLSGLSRAVEDGVLTLRVARTLPVEDAAEAHRLIEAGGIRGRLVLTF